MAAINHYTVVKGPDGRVDGLCTKCFNPALKLAVCYHIDLEGIEPVGDRVLCSDCHIWQAPLRKYENV